MKEVIIYHNGECTKSKGALELLQEKGIPHQVRYYLMEPLDRTELSTLLTKLGIPASALVRRSEPLYLSQYADKEISEDEWLDILTEHPELIERPIVESGDHAVIARPAERVFEVIQD
jgi:arsenate reductase